MSPTDEVEVASIIQSMKRHKAPGPDGIKVELLKILVENLAPIITKIINSCLMMGLFSKALKVATIIASYKSGEPPQAIFQYH